MAKFVIKSHFILLYAVNDSLNTSIMTTKLTISIYFSFLSEDAADDGKYFHL